MSDFLLSLANALMEHAVLELVILLCKCLSEKPKLVTRRDYAGGMEVPKHQHCSPNVTLENCHAFYVELEPLEGMRYQFMFWRGAKLSEAAGLTIYKPRIRDLRPGDVVVFEKFRRTVKLVEIYR